MSRRAHNPNAARKKPIVTARVHAHARGDIAGQCRPLNYLDATDLHRDIVKELEEAVDYRGQKGTC